MNNYVRYRRWWMATVYMPYLQTETFDNAFGQHINSMTLYELMETLEAWEEEEVPVQEPDIYDMWDNMVEKIKQQSRHSPMEQTPSFPRPYIKYPTIDNPKPQCPKCGLGLSGVMGYVCSDQHCPTFMKVTC